MNKETKNENSSIGTVKELREQVEKLKAKLKKQKDVCDAHDYNYACYQEAKAEIDDKISRILYLESILQQIKDTVNCWKSKEEFKSELQKQGKLENILAQIKKCPKCGNIEMQFIVHRHSPEVGDCYIRCFKCGFSTADFNSIDTAINSWNDTAK